MTHGLNERGFEEELGGSLVTRVADKTQGQAAGDKMSVMATPPRRLTASKDVVVAGNGKRLALHSQTFHRARKRPCRTRRPVVPHQTCRNKTETHRPPVVKGGRRETGRR